MIGERSEAVEHRRKAINIARSDERPRLVLAYQFRDARDARADDGSACGVGFEQRERCVLEALRVNHYCACGRKDRDQRLLALMPRNIASTSSCWASARSSVSCGPVPARVTGCLAAAAARKKVATPFRFSSRPQ